MKTQEQIKQDLEKKVISLRYWLLGRNYLTSVKALEYAKEIHVGLRKDNITPELDHLIRVTQYVRTFEKSLISPDVTISAALLHDIHEDYDIPLHILQEKFGEEVSNAVMKLSKIVNGLKKDNEFYYGHITTCPIASVVKGCDRAHNFQTMIGVFTPAKQFDYMQEGIDFTIPMLKKARRNFPEQEPVYENLKLMLKSQIELIMALDEE